MAWACTSSPKGARNISSPTMAGSSGEVAPEVTKGMPADWNRGAEASAKVVSLWPMPAARPSMATARLAAVAASLVSFLVSMARDLDHPAVEQAAGVVDHLCLQLRAVQRRPVDRGEAAARHVVERGDRDRLGCHSVHGAERSGRREPQVLMAYGMIFLPSYPVGSDSSLRYRRIGPVQPRRSGSAVPKRPAGR